MSSRSFSVGSLGINRRFTPGRTRRKSFYQLDAPVFWNFLTVRFQASQVSVYCVSNVSTSFLKRPSPGMATREGGNISVESVVFIWLNDDSICIKFHALSIPLAVKIHNFILCYNFLR